MSITYCKKCKQPIGYGFKEFKSEQPKLKGTSKQLDYIKKNNIKNQSLDTCDDCFKEEVQ